MTIAGLLAYALALAIAVAIPGPGIVALVARSLGSGLAGAMPFVVGLALGDIVYLAAACFGLALVADALGAFFVVIRYAAAAYLLWLAVALWRSAGAGARLEAKRPAGPGASLMAGLGVSLGNPKVIFFYLAVLPTILDLGHVTLADFAGLAAITFAILVAVLLPYAALASKARSLLRTPRALSRLNRSAAAVMAGAAVWIVVRRA